MSKRYTEQDDLFIVNFFDSIGDEIGPHDLSRSKSSVRARAKHLKKTGAWDSHKRANVYRLHALIVSGVCKLHDIELAWQDEVTEMRFLNLKLPE